MPHTARGRILSVNHAPRGSALAADAAVDADTLVVDDTGYFEETGGFLALGDALLSYLSVDDDAATITLEEPLQNLYTEGEPVLVYDDLAGGVIADTVALVQLDGGSSATDEAVQVVIPVELAGYFQLGIRTGRGEPVEVLFGDDGSARLTAKKGELPRLEGAALAKGEVSPQSMQVSMLGGAFSNLVHDPGFVDTFFTKKRLDEADDAGFWTFEQNVNLFYDYFASGQLYWGAGPNTALTLNTAGVHEFLEVTVPVAVSADDVILTGWDVLSTPPTTGDTYTVGVQPLQRGILGGNPPTFSFEVEAQWVDGGGVPLGSPVASGLIDMTGIEIGAPIGLDLVAVAGAAGVQITYYYRSTPSPYSTPNPGTDLWCKVAVGPQPTYRFRVSRYGLEVDPGEWFAQSDRAVLGAGEVQAQRLPVATFAVDRTAMYGITVRTQEEPGLNVGGAPFAKAEIVFYDVDGNELVADVPNQGTNRSNAHPEWALRSAVYRTPADAVTAVACLTSMGGGSAAGKVRFRMPQVSVVGWYDKSTGHGATIGPLGLSFFKDFSATTAGSVDLFNVEIDYETSGVDVFSRATWWLDGNVKFLGRADFTNAFVDGLPLSQLEDVDPAVFAASEGDVLTFTGGKWTAGGGAGAPAGAMEMFAGPVAPDGYLLCDGAAVSRSTYATLYAAIGDAWGAGDGSSTFNLPDMRGRFPLGVNAGTKDLGETDGFAVGSRDAELGHSHNHSISDDGWHGHAIGADGNHGHSASTPTGNPSYRNPPDNGSFQAPSKAYFDAHSHTVNAAGSHSHGGGTGGAGTHSHGAATGTNDTGPHPFAAINFIIKT